MLRFAQTSAVVALFAVGACDGAFDPRGPAPEEAVTIYGTLDSALAEQHVRIEEVRPGARPTGGAPVSARLVDEQDGTVLPAVPRTVSDGAGGTARGVSIAGPLRQGRAYRLDVTRADGVTASATTRVPSPRAATVEPAVADSLGRLRQRVAFAGAAAASRALLTYRVVRTPTPTATAGDTLRVSLDALLRTTTGAGGVRVAVSVVDDRPALLERLGLTGAQAARVRVLDVTAEIAEAGPDGRRPGREGMVRAYGAFAAVGRSAATFVPDARLLAAAGFRP